MERPDPMICSKPGAQDVTANANRVAWMAALFEMDGRDQISHPMHGLYTGLAAKYQSYESTDG